MATAVMMKNKNTDEVKTTYVGFSWTTLCLGPLGLGAFPALFRLDFKYFLIQMVVHAILFCFIPVLGNMVFGIAMAVVYNKLYTKDLLEKGFVFCDNPALNEVAAVKVGCKPSARNCDHLE